MKRPASSVLGLFLGILLAFGVAVSAFQSPQLVPPAGNVPAPLNAGSVDQTKTGGLLQVFGLWVNQSLGVSGGATFGGTLNLQGNRITNAGLPSAAGDATTKGYEDLRVNPPVSKGLYGSCVINSSAPLTPFGCNLLTPPLAPAFCSTTASSSYCGCEAGYSLVATGAYKEPSFGYVYVYYSCYKN